MEDVEWCVKVSSVRRESPIGPSSASARSSTMCGTRNALRLTKRPLTVETNLEGERRL